MGKKGKKGPAPKQLSPRLVTALEGLKDEANKASSAANRAESAMAIASLTRGSDVHRHDAVTANCLTPMVGMLAKGTAKEKEAAACALRALSTNPSVYTLRGLPFAAYDNPTAIVQANAAEPLVAVLLESSTSSDALKEYAAATISNLATKAPHRLAIANAGAIAPLLRLVTHGTDAVSMAAAYALGSLAFGCPPNRSAMLEGMGDLDGKRVLETMLKGADEAGDERRRRIAEYALRALLEPTPKEAEAAEANKAAGAPG